MAKKAHIVEITYKADQPFVDPEKEKISFSSETAARDFARRQSKKSDVAAAKYLGESQ